MYTDTQTHRDFLKQTFLPQIHVEHLTNALHNLSVTRGTRLAKQWALIGANFDPILEIEPQVGDALSQEYGIYLYPTKCSRYMYLFFFSYLAAASEASYWQRHCHSDFPGARV